MALITANNVAVLSGTIQMPLAGVWSADLVLDQPDGSGFDEGTAVSISAVDGFTLKGTVAPKRTGDFLDSVHVRVLGGKAGLGKTSSPKGYAQPQALVRDVLNGLMNDSGESLSSDISQSLLQTNLNAWMVSGRAVSESIDNLLELVVPESKWRILADGTLWIGTESWKQSDAKFEMLNANPVEGQYELGVQSPSIVPGMSLSGIGNVSRVEHEILAWQIRSRVWTPTEQEPGIADSIEKIVEHRTSKIDFFALYDAKVNSQSGDLLTVDVTPNDTRLGGLQRVPLRHGLPGCKVQVPNGVTLRLGWDRGDPRLPFAALWQGGESPQRIQLGGDTDAARKGDHSDGGSWVFTFGAGTGAATLSIVYTDPDGHVTTLASGSGTVSAKSKLTEGSSIVGLG